MATVTVQVSSALGDFSFIAEVDSRVQAWQDGGAPMTRAEIAEALEQAADAARRSYQIEETR